MTDTKALGRPTPPPAPPAPPNRSALGGAPTPAVAAAKTPKEEMLQIVADLRRIGSAVPTPNVVDSQLHGGQLQEIAAKLNKLAEKM